MATRPETVEFILSRLGRPGRFAARAMFGEYALYGDGRVVGLVCDDQLHVKVQPATAALAASCELAPPYPGARPHYLVEESQLSSLEDLPEILLALAASLPTPKVAKRSKK